MKNAVLTLHKWLKRKAARTPILVPFYVTLPLFVVLLVLWNLLQTPWNKLFFLKTYSTLLSAFDSVHAHDTAAGTHGKLRVVVVDISHIEVVTPPKGEGEPRMDRVALRKLIYEIAAQKPAAIGVDNDFSLHVGTATPSDDSSDNNLDTKPYRDEPLFNAVLKYPAPIYLGVFKRMNNKDDWLGRPAVGGKSTFDRLAAAIPAEKNDAVHMPMKLKNGLPTMASAMADQASWRSVAKGWLPRTLVSYSDIKQKDGISHVLVNYSMLGTLKDNTLYSLEPKRVPEYHDYFAGNLVLLGEAQHPRDPGDTFNVPGEKTPVPGVFLHACAVYTLTQERIYELPPSFRVLLDIVVFLLCFSLIWLAMFCFHRDKIYNAEEYLKICSPWLKTAGGVVVLSGFYISYHLHIFWFDYLVVSAALLFSGWYASVYSIVAKIGAFIRKSCVKFIKWARIVAPTLKQKAIMRLQNKKIGRAMQKQQVQNGIYVTHVDGTLSIKFLPWGTQQNAQEKTVTWHRKTTLLSLRPGEQIRCREGSVTVSHYGKEETYNGDSGWKTIQKPTALEPVNINLTRAGGKLGPNQRITAFAPFDQERPNVERSSGLTFFWEWSGAASRKGVFALCEHGISEPFFVLPKAVQLADEKLSQELTQSMRDALIEQQKSGRSRIGEPFFDIRLLITEEPPSDIAAWDRAEVLTTFEAITLDKNNEIQKKLNVLRKKERDQLEVELVCVNFCAKQNLATEATFTLEKAARLAKGRADIRELALTALRGHGFVKRAAQLERELPVRDWNDFGKAS